MRIEQLKYLVDIAETKSMSKTAERLFVSTQTVSKSIKQLESELGAELLRRTNAGVVLTPVGDSIAALAENVLHEVQQMHQIVEENSQTLQQEYSLSLRICSTSAIINIVLPDIIAAFSHMGIEVILNIYAADSLQDVFEHVESGKCDLGLVTYNEEELLRKFASYQDRLHMDLLARDDQVVVMDAHLHRPEREFLTVADFNSHYRSVFSFLPVDQWTEYSKAMHVTRSNDADFHRAMIKKNDAYVLMPRLAYQHFFSGKSYMALPLENHWAKLLHAAVYRRDTPGAFQRFISMLRMGLQ